MGNEMDVNFKEEEAIMMFVASAVTVKEVVSISVFRIVPGLFFQGAFVLVLGIFQKFCILFAILLCNCACAAISKRMLHLLYLCQFLPFSCNFSHI